MREPVYFADWRFFYVQLREVFLQFEMTEIFLLPELIFAIFCSSRRTLYQLLLLFKLRYALIFEGEKTEKLKMKQKAYPPAMLKKNTVTVIMLRPVIFY